MSTLKNDVINSLKNAQEIGLIPSQGWVVENFNEYPNGIVQFELYTPNFRGVVSLFHYPFTKFFRLCANSHSGFEVVNHIINSSQFIHVLKMLRYKSEEVVGERAPQEPEQTRAAHSLSF